MISFLTGTVKVSGGDFIVLLAGSVGYQVFVTRSTVINSQVGSKLDLFIETVVKENEITLFGFQSYKELVWFKSFIKISGVGAKIALLILSTFPLNQIVSSIENQDKNFFLSVSGIGDKLATRLINEAKKEPKKNSTFLLSIKVDGETLEEDTQALETPQFNRSIVLEAINALENLGFNKNSIQPYVVKIFNENKDIKIEELIKLSLKELKN